MSYKDLSQTKRYQIYVLMNLRQNFNTTTPDIRSTQMFAQSNIVLTRRIADFSDGTPDST